MKVCMITSGHGIFDSRIYYKEILSLKNMFTEIYLIAPGEKNFTTKDGIKVLCFKKRKTWYARIRPMKDMYELALSVNADVYHAHEPDSYTVAVKLKNRLGSKIIYDSHEYYPESFAEHFTIGKKLVEKFVYSYEKYYASKADCIITVNKLLVDKFKTYNNNVLMLPNYPTKKLIEPIKKYNDTPTFVYVGGLSEERGILKILQSIRLINEKYKYIFVGSFDNKHFKDKVDSYISKYLKDRQIIFTGSIPHDQVANYLKDAFGGFVLLQPDNWRYVNSEPIKLFEYMANKVPIIGSDYSMISSIIKKSNCGLLVDPTNPYSIAEAIKELANNTSKVTSMGENGYNQVKNIYNWTSLESKLVETYNNLCNF